MSARILVGLVLVLFSAIAAAAVTLSRDNKYADDMAIPAGGTVYIYPIAPGASFLSNGSERILDELVAQLEKRKFSVKFTDQPDTPEVEYSLFFKPYLGIRTASVSRKYARWDGVSHRMPIKGPGASSSEWRGKTRGVSLILEVYSGTGEWLFTSYGGVALPDYTDLRVFESKLKDDVYDSKRNIKDGVRAALLPLGKWK